MGYNQQQEPELIKKNPELLTSSFSPNEWKSVKGETRYVFHPPFRSVPYPLTYALSHVADLTEREWSVIIRMNCLLSGHRIMTTQYMRNGEPMEMSLDGIERSPYNGMTLQSC